MADATHQQDARLDCSAGSKLSRFILPLVIVTIPFNLLVNYLYACAGGSDGGGFEIPIERRLQPSLSKLFYAMFCLYCAYAEQLVPLS